MFADADLPGKFAEDEIGVGVGSLKMLVILPEVVGGGEGSLRQFLANADVVPMAVVFGEVASGLVRIEKHILVPVIADAFDHNAAPLKADDFVIRAAKLATRTKRNERAVHSDNGFKFLENLKIGILGIENGMATL